MSNYTVESLLTSGGGPASFKFPVIGTSVTGTVTDEQVEQSRSYDPDGPGSLEFWDNGRPKLQLVLTVETEADGPRRLFAKGLMLKALKSAAAQHGMKSLLGARITVTYVADTPKRAKEYVVEVQPPQKGGEVADLLSGPVARQSNTAAVAEAKAKIEELTQKLQSGELQTGVTPSKPQ